MKLAFWALNTYHVTLNRLLSVKHDQYLNLFQLIYIMTILVVWDIIYIE